MLGEPEKRSSPGHFPLKYPGRSPAHYGKRRVLAEEPVSAPSARPSLSRVREPQRRRAAGGSGLRDMPAEKASLCSNVCVEGQCHLCCCAERGEDLQALRRRRGAAQVVKPPSAPSCSPVVPESQRLEPSPVLQSPELQTRPFRRTYARSPCVLTPLFGIGVVPLTHVIGSVPAVAKQPSCTSVVGLCGKGWPGQSS